MTFKFIMIAAFVAVVLTALGGGEGLVIAIGIYAAMVLTRKRGN